MSIIGIFVYGMDITKNGELGDGTLRRLEQAVWCHLLCPEADLVVAADMSPQKVPELMVPMRDQMAAWLEQHGVPKSQIQKPVATSFDTDGEQEAFCACGYSHEIHVSDWWHLERIRVTRERRPSEAITIHYVGTGWHWPPLGAVMKEVLKYLIVRYAPGLKPKLQTLIRKSPFRTSW